MLGTPALGRQENCCKLMASLVYTVRPYLRAGVWEGEPRITQK